MFDLSLGKIAVIAVLALFLLGPDKLPQYAAQLGKWVRVARSLTDDAKKRLASEMGPEFEDVDWATLDPRRYTPKRMLQEAWNSSAPGDRPLPERTDADASGDDRREPDLLDAADARAHRAAEVDRRDAVPARPFDLT